MIVSVEQNQLPAFRDKIDATGCHIARERPRTGYATDGTLIRDVEIILPEDWLTHEIELTDAIHRLPGVRVYWTAFGFGGKNRFLKFLNWCFWTLGKSGG